MALIALADLGIGDYSQEAYIRIEKVEYHPDAFTYNTDGTTYITPEVEIFFASYHNKTCRQLEIIKEFVKDYLAAHADTINPIKKKWLEDNIQARAARPLQTYSWATKNLFIFEGINFALVSPTAFVPYMYGWIKSHPVVVVGNIQNVKDDVATVSDTIEAFRRQLPDIFGA